MPPKTLADLEECRQLITGSTRILALCGAGLSASSGLPTFRGAGGLWRNRDPMSLATPQAFAADPGLVWSFYAWRRSVALQAEPNAAHFALAQLARQKPGFLCLTQNVDGLSPRAGHPPSSLRTLHGNLFDLKCFNRRCDYLEPFVTREPLCDALATSSSSFSSTDHPQPPPPPSALPHCPKCASLLRPGVVWFGEALPAGMLHGVDVWLGQQVTVDVMLVVGTQASVYPAAGFVPKARARGATLVVVNPDEAGGEGLRAGDFFLKGDAAEILPRLMEGGE